MPSTEYHNMYRDKASKQQESHLEKNNPEITSKTHLMSLKDLIEVKSQRISHLVKNTLAKSL